MREALGRVNGEATKRRASVLRKDVGGEQRYRVIAVVVGPRLLEAKLNLKIVLGITSHKVINHGNQDQIDDLN